MCVWWQDWFKMKMSQKTHIMVVLPKLSSLFVKTLICDALLWCNLFNDMMHTKWICHALTQGIRTIKTFIKYKKCCCLSINLSIKKNTRKQCQMLSLLWQNKNLNQRYKHQLGILQKFSNFCCNIEIFVAFHLYFASNITLVLRFKISNKFYHYVQTAKC